MSMTSYRRTYRCWNDCQPQGCPGHEAILEFQSVSDTLSFDNGKGARFSLQPPELEAFLSMLNALVDTNYSHVINEAVKTAFGLEESELVKHEPTS